MSISTYTELQAAVASYLARSDLTANIPDFITLAESRFNRELRTHDMETSATVTMTAGSGSLPTGYLEWISATWGGASRNGDLRYMSPDSEEWRFRYRPNGDPTMFTILAGMIKLRPVATGNITLVYYSTVPALASNSTNWLLTRAPDLYLYTALAESYIFTKNPEGATAMLQLADVAMGKAIVDGDSNKLARRPTKGAETQDSVTASQSASSGI